MKKNKFYYQIIGILFAVLSLITNFLMFQEISYLLIEIIFLSIPDILVIFSFLFFSKKKVSRFFLISALTTTCVFCYIFPWLTSYSSISFWGSGWGNYYSTGIYLILCICFIRNYKKVKYGFIGYSIYIVFDIFLGFLGAHYIINILNNLFFSISIWIYLLHKYNKYYIKPKHKIKSLELKLIKYKDQYEKGEISEEEYSIQKQEILAKCKTIAF